MRKIAQMKNSRQVPVWHEQHDWQGGLLRSCALWLVYLMLAVLTAYFGGLLETQIGEILRVNDLKWQEVMPSQLPAALPQDVQGPAPAIIKAAGP